MVSTMVSNRIGLAFNIFKMDIIRYSLQNDLLVYW